MTIGEKIRAIRKSKGITQKDLAIAMGVSASMIGQYEVGIRSPKIETLKKIAQALGVDVNALLDLSSPNAEERMTGENICDIQGLLSDSSESEYEEMLKMFFNMLSKMGKEIAIQRIAELSENPRYRVHPRICVNLHDGVE